MAFVPWEGASEPQLSLSGSHYSCAKNNALITSLLHLPIFVKYRFVFVFTLFKLKLYASSWFINFKVLLLGEI